MRRSSTILTIASGKGGVGKSVLSVNLAAQLAAEGYRVALLDADLGQGACAALLNTTPPRSVLDCVRQQLPLTAAGHTVQDNLLLVEAVAEAGGADAHQAALYTHLDLLLDTLLLTHQYVIIDAPAGVDGPVRWALDRAHLGVLVLAGEPTAVADAYRLCKLTWQADAAYPLALVVNFSDTEEEARSVAGRFVSISEKFTGQAPFYLGWLPFSAAVRQSVRSQAPFVYQQGPATEALARIAATLAQGRRLDARAARDMAPTDPF